MLLKNRRLLLDDSIHDNSYSEEVILIEEVSIPAVEVTVINKNPCKCGSLFHRNINNGYCILNKKRIHLLWADELNEILTNHHERLLLRAEQKKINNATMKMHLDLYRI